MITLKHATILKQYKSSWLHFVKLTKKREKKYSGPNKTNSQLQTREPGIAGLLFSLPLAAVKILKTVDKDFAYSVYVKYNIYVFILTFEIF